MRNIRVATLGVALGLVGLVGSVSVVGCGEDPAMEEPVESSDPTTGSLTDNFPGTWELTAVELADATGNPISVPGPPAFGSDGAVGQLIADTDGHLGLAIMQQGRPRYEEPTLEEAVADLDGYAALFGSYTVSDSSGLVMIEIQGSRDPRLTGTVQTSVVTLVGDDLVMELPLSDSGVQPTLRWRRLPDITELTPTHRQVIGFWKHVPNEGDAGTDPPLRPGFIIYTAAGQMMVHLLDPRREPYAGADPTPEEAQATVTSYTSYFGPFSVDEAGSYFVHHRIGHTLDLTDQPKPERRTGLDTDGQRFYEFIGNRMVLRFLSTAGVRPAPAAGEADWGGMITWERLSSRVGQ